MLQYAMDLPPTPVVFSLVILSFLSFLSFLSCFFSFPSVWCLVGLPLTIILRVAARRMMCK